MYHYFDLAVGGANNRNNIQDEREFDLTTLQGKVDVYDSLYRFPKEFKEHFEVNKTVAGYKGPVASRYLVFDIDNEDLAVALDATKWLVEKISLESTEVYFSGAKGFHVYIPEAIFGGFTPSPDLPKIQARLAKSLAKKLEIDTSIYERNRIFRVANTINSKTGLYKIKVSVQDSINSILAEAETPDPDDRGPCWFTNCWEIPRVDKMVEAYKAAMREPIRSLPVLPAASSRKLCIDDLLKGVNKGERHNAAFRLADHWKKQGCEPAVILANLKEWNKRNEDNTEADSHFEGIVKDILERGYDFGCFDPVLDNRCDKGCYLYPAKSGEKTENTQSGNIPVKLSEISTTEVAWLWKPFIPIGKLTMLEGEPEIGKSWTLLRIVTALTRGHTLPRSNPLPAGNALLLMGEDSLSDTIKPRLEIMGADIPRVYVLEELLVLNEDGLLTVENAVKKAQAKLVIIDPLVAYMGADVDINRANHMRTMMAGLGKVAERQGCAIICLRHLTKSNMDGKQEKNPLHRGIGSIDLSASVRSVLRMERMKDSNLGLLEQIKNNLAKKGEPVYYEITDKGLIWKAV